MLFRILFALTTLSVFEPAFANVSPEVLESGAHRLLRSSAGTQDVDLKTLFRDPDVTGTAVRINFRIGSTTKPVDLALFDQATPITAANFVAYVNAGAYTANFIHRSVPGFIIQGGGFAWAQNGVVSVPTFPAIQNEPGISNLRGTVAMAKLGGDPNSATSQWFINLADNSGAPAYLDAQNGGFTVFARVLGNGMAVADEVAALPRENANPPTNPLGPFSDLPVKDFAGGSVFRVHTVETDAAIIPALSFTATSNDPALVGVSVTGSTLRLTPASDRTGATTVTLSATDLDGATTEATLSVEVLGWHAQNGADGQPATFILNAADSTSVVQNPLPVQWGAVSLDSFEERTFNIHNDGPTTLTDFTATITGANAAEYTVTEGTGPVILAPGGITTVRVSFSPAAGGPRTAMLRLASNDPGEASLQLALSGEGIDTTFPALTPATAQVLTAGVLRTAEVPEWRGNLVMATDNAGVVSFTQSPAPGTILRIGEHVLIFSASDAAGNTTTVQSTLTVQYDVATLPALTVSAAYGGAPVPAQGSGGLPDGSALSAFGTPAISDDRSLAARVTITAGRARLAGIYFENEAGQNRLVARQGLDSGVPNTKFKSFRDPLLSPSGAIAFAATLNGGKATENEGVWTDLFGNLQPVLLKGADLPGQPGLKLKSVTSLSFDEQIFVVSVGTGPISVGAPGTIPAQSDAATMGVTGGIQPAGLVVSGPGNLVLTSNQGDALLASVKLVRVPGVVTAANDSALIRITGPTSSVVLARTGAPFDGSTIKQISVLQPAARSPGQGRWNGGSGRVAKLTLADRRSVVVRLLSDGTKVPLLRTGSPDANAGGATLATLGLPALGGSGVALFATYAKQAGFVTAGNDGTILYAADGTTFSEVIREEPGASKFASFSDPVANDQGELLFFGTARPAVPRTPNTSALWLADGSAPPEIVARVGGAAVDRAGQTISDATWSEFPSFALPDGPGAGPVFAGQLAGRAVNGQSKLGLWALDSGGVVRLLLRTGEDVVLPSGTKRVTKFTVLNALPGSFGARRSYNSTGAVAVQATFSDRSQAVLRLDIP